MSTSGIRLLLSDVDGTLVTSDKLLTEESIRAVRRLRDAGILFAITSSRPPRGLAMFIDPLNLTTPLAAFNGGTIFTRDMGTIEQRTIRVDLVAATIDLMVSHDLSVWVYQGDDWFVLDCEGPHVQNESRTAQFEPTKLATFDTIEGDVAKVVGVSDDTKAVAKAHVAMGSRFGVSVSVTTSQTYYLDVTDPDANKGRVADVLSKMFNIPRRSIATIGDMHNDISMFARSGLAIAMGNGVQEVRDAADHVTWTNDDEGFAHAVERFVLRA
jgi:Cof subfamily protein (haloacid dehalogenase superfamily)